MPSMEVRFCIGKHGFRCPWHRPCGARLQKGIENGLHWSLGAAHREDESRIRDPRVAENIVVLRQTALIRLRSEKSFKVGIKEQCLHIG